MASSSSISVREASLTLGFLLLLSALAFRSLIPPAMVSASASANQFSAERAFKHSQFISREPHPTGSAANASVRDYIVNQLSSLGLEPQMQEAVAATSWDIGGAPYASGVVQNVLGRVSGSNSTGAVLLMAHYDSVATGPGAGDNGSGVVTLLESLRILRNDPPLKNDLVYVFTDGEEDGGLGAQAFVDEYPWLKDISVALIADSNGCGVVAMSVFAQHNGWLIRESARAVPRALAASISDQVGKLSGGAASGDHLQLSQKGVPVLGLGAAACQTSYHTMQDNLRQLDSRTLQDLGNYVLPLARHFGNLDLKRTSQDDVIHFSFFGHLIYYPDELVLPSFVGTLFVLACVVLLGFRQKVLTGRGVALSVLLWVVGATVTGGLITLLSWALLKLHLVNRSFTSAYNAQLYAIAFGALAAAIATATCAAFPRKVGSKDFAAGAFLFCGALMILTYVLASGATYLIMWPLIFALLPMGYAVALNRTDSQQMRIARLFCTVPAIALFVPLIGYLGIATVDPAQNFVILGILTMILFALIAELIERIVTPNRMFLPGACFAVAVAFVAFGALRSGYDAEHPKPDSISYWFDGDAGKASWISFDERPDDWTSQFLTTHPQADKLDIFGAAGGDAVLEAPAPKLSFPLPVVKTIEDSTTGSERTLRFQVSSPRQARVIWVIARNATVLRATLEGRHVQVGEVDRRNRLWGFSFLGLPPDGVHFDLTVNAPETPQLTVTDQSDALADVPVINIKPRGRDRMPLPEEWPFFDSTTLVTRTFMIDKPLQNK